MRGELVETFEEKGREKRAKAEPRGPRLHVGVGEWSRESVHESWENFSSSEKFDRYLIITAVISREKVKMDSGKTWLAASQVRTLAKHIKTESVLAEKVLGLA